MPKPAWVGCYQETESEKKNKYSVDYTRDEWNKNPSNVTYCAKACRKFGATYAGLQVS